MKRIALFVLSLVGLFELPAQEANAEGPRDVIVFRDPTTEPLAGDVLFYGKDDLRVKIYLPGGAGSSERLVPLDTVAHVEFGLTVADKALLALANWEEAGTALHERWAKDILLLPREKSLVGDFGLRYATLLLEQDKPDIVAVEQALRICLAIAEKDWSTDRRLKARQARLQLLLAAGKTAEALEESKAFAAESEDPRFLLRAEYVMTLARLAELHQLEEEHPRWSEEDDIRPKREALFHESLDQLITPSLFHGSSEDEAAQGLATALEEAERSGDRENAAHYARDLVFLYPETTHAAKGKAFLELHQLPLQPELPEEPAEEEPEDAKPEEAPAAPEPPETKKPPGKTSSKRKSSTEEAKPESKTEPPPAEKP